MNTFQKYLLNPNNIHIIWEIINAYLPNLEKTYISPYTGKEKQIIPKVYECYNGICIEIPKFLNIGIIFNIPFHGLGYKEKDFEELSQIPNNFKAWKFAWGNIDDKEIDINQIFNKYNIPKPIALEMLEYYYKDI